MKKITRILILVAVVSVAALTKAKAQVDIGVSLQLQRPHQYDANEMNHPNRPSPNHVWLAEEWVPNGHGGYTYQPGAWSLPPQLVYNKGHWQQQANGRYTWVSGRWGTTINGRWWHLVPGTL
ncbi:MAG TPA: hypothetical protein VFE53_08615 [Mucilaginibacter sp.]|nr:hypothetical protein [Mucilaginibacter sp.]